MTVPARKDLSTGTPAASIPDAVALADRIRAGDASAFEALVRAYYGPLVVFAARMLNAKADAEDVVQDVFVRLWSHSAG